MKYYSTKEVAERFGVKIKTVWNWIESGRLKGYRIGKFYRFTQEQLDAFVKEQSK